jgi:hypothetical protein
VRPGRQASVHKRPIDCVCCTSTAPIAALRSTQPDCAASHRRGQVLGPVNVVKVLDEALGLGGRRAHDAGLLDPWVWRGGGVGESEAARGLRTACAAACERPTGGRCSIVWLSACS